ncbi:MAG: hypothetical protein JXA41_01050 [Deltaproteobacteria bacterium]|nr:hypothetical protein [Deltaproteobacteria bacterium]
MDRAERQLPQGRGVFRSVKNSPEEVIQNILELKLKVYDEFLSCTQLLGQCLEKEDVREVDRLIRRRDDLIRTIDKLDGKMAHIRKTPLGHNNRVTRSVETIFTDLNEKIKRIVAVNEDCREIAHRRCMALNKGIQTVRHEKNGRMKYVAKIQQRLPKFLDIRS